MKKIYLLEGLDCPHCSAEIEKDIGKIKGIESANINLMKQTLTLEFSEGFNDEHFLTVKKIVHKHEPDVEVTEKKISEKNSHHEHEHCHHEHGEHEHCHHEHDEHEHCHHEHGEHEHCHHEHGEHEHCHYEHGEHEHCHHEHDEHEHCHHEHGEHEHCHHKHCEHEHCHHEHGELEHCHHEHNKNHVHLHNNGDIDKVSTNTRSYLLKGLDCPHCSAEIEKDILKIEGIKSSGINLVKELLTVELEDGFGGEILDEVEKTVHKHEPDVEVIDNNTDHSSKKKSSPDNGDSPKKASFRQKIKSDKFTVIRFSVGAVIYAIGFALTLAGNVSIQVTLPVLVTAYIILGGDVISKAVRNILKGRVFDENFLMTVSTVGAFIIGEYPEAVAVMLFYQVGEFFQSLAVKRSRKSISDLMDIRPDSANVKRHGKLLTVSPEEVEIGETIVIKPGEKIPLDGVVTDGESMIDTTALTGESVPRKVRIGDPVLSGCINDSGVINVKVTKEFGESTASKIIDLVENAAGRKAPTENFITVFSRYYTPVVVILAAMLGIIPPLLFGGNWAEWVRRCFVFLVISCPCALVISIPLTFFGGIGAASKRGVLVKGSNYLEALNSVETIVFDKTGTLTKGVFNVTDIIPVNNVKKEKLLETAAKAEIMSNHPIARSVVRAYGKEIDKSSVKNYREISGHGIEAEIDSCIILAGNERLMNDNGIKFEKSEKTGTVVYISENKKFIGSIVISDEIKDDGKAAISGLKELGIRKTVMLTGDSETIAKATAAELGIDDYFGELLPSQKVEKLELLDETKSPKKKIAFVGDGINDAPVLARADVGIAMGALGSDAAIEAADIVLMTDEPSKLIDAVKTARFTKKIVMQNIVLVIAVKIIFLALGALGIAGMWEAVFGDVGIMIIAVINSMRILRKQKQK